MNIDVKTASLQTIQAELDIYEMPLRVFGDLSLCEWLLFTVSYGVFNANAEWQVLSDTILTSIRFRKTALLPQLFVLFQYKCTVFVVVKIVDDLLVAVSPATTDPNIS